MVLFCIDLGGTRTKYGLVDGQNGRLLCSTVHPTQTGGYPEFLQAIQQALGYLCARAGIDRTSVQGAGIGVPGYVEGDFISKVWDALYFIEGKGFRDVFEETIRIPLRMDNDARLVALGEAYYGGFTQARRLLSLTIGTGLGISLVVDGELQEKTAANHLAGHILIRPGVKDCFCGLSGCLEVLVCGSTLEEKYHERGGEIVQANPKMIMKDAHEGEQIASGVVDELIQDLTVGLNVYINVFAPDQIVIGGGIGRGLKPYLGKIKDGLVCAPFMDYAVQVSISRLGERAGIYGAAALWRELSTAS